MSRDPGAIIAREDMGMTQILAVGLCILLVALDGFDVLSISFASPGIAKEWGIDRAALGIVLSMELIGMAVGSIALGALADRIGRRPTILGCLVVMACGMLLAAYARDVMALSLFRMGTGLGIGGILACTNAMTAELSNDRRRNLAVALSASGYPLGAALGGTAASFLLISGSWRSVFIFGGCASVILIPIALLLLPESVNFLARGKTPGALARVNHALKRMGHSPVDGLPEISPAASRTSILTLFEPQLVRKTLLLTLIYFGHIMTFYFILKWVPKIVVDMGFPASSAAGVLVWANIGGACGALLISLLTQRYDVNVLVMVALLCSCLTVTLFGQVQASLMQLSLLSGFAGFFTNGAIVGIYALIAKHFPTNVRAGGTGFVIGVGRGGAALGPIVAGLLFASGAGLGVVSFAMALGSLVAVAALFVLGFSRRHLAELGA